MADKPYTIFVCDPTQMVTHIKGETPPERITEIFESTPGDEWWQAHGPIAAPSSDKAIEKLWEMAPEMKVNTDLLYHVEANFRPKKQRRSFIERWGIDYADKPDDEVPGQTELAT